MKYTFFGMFGGSCRYEDTEIMQLYNLLSLQKKINTIFSALIITFIVQMNHQKKSISLLIFTPFYESLQLYIESKKNDTKGGGITGVCLLFNHNAANFCRLQKSKCMVNQIIHHFTMDVHITYHRVSVLWFFSWHLMN